jgi:hypothetical protein
MKTQKLSKSHILEFSNYIYKGSVEYEQGNEAGEMEFMLKCTNLPVGTIVGFSCGQGGPIPPINLPPTVVTTYPTFVTGLMSYVPANFEGVIYYYGDFKETPPADAKITLQIFYTVNGE